MTSSPTFSPPPRPRHRRQPPVRQHPYLRHLVRRHRRRHGGIITRLARPRSADRAFRQSAAAKLTVPRLVVLMVLRTPPAQVDNLEWMPKKHARTQLRDHAVEIRAKMMTLPGEQFVIRRQAYAMIKKG